MRGDLSQSGPDRFALRLVTAILASAVAVLLIGPVLTRGTIRLTSSVLSWFYPDDQARAGVVAATVGSNRHLLWLAVVSLAATSAILWGRWRRNVAVFLAGLATFVPLTVTVYCLLSIARLRGGSQVLSNVAGLVSLLMPGAPMLLVFLIRVSGNRR